MLHPGTAAHTHLASLFTLRTAREGEVLSKNAWYRQHEYQVKLAQYSKNMIVEQSVDFTTYCVDGEEVHEYFITRPIPSLLAVCCSCYLHLHVM